jgi:hypothetical protein
VEFDGIQSQVPPVPTNMSVFDWLPKKKLDLLAVIEAFTEMMYAIAKKVANPALTSVKNLEPFLQPKSTSNHTLGHSHVRILDLWLTLDLGKGTKVTWPHTQPIVSNYVLEIMY